MDINQCMVEVSPSLDNPLPYLDDQGQRRTLVQEPQLGW